MFQKNLQILSDTVSDETYIFRLIPKNTIKIQKFHFLDKICEEYKTEREARGPERMERALGALKLASCARSAR